MTVFDMLFILSFAVFITGVILFVLVAIYDRWKYPW